ncbi:phthiocerol/phenolphthiocerol synthesis type-I polyketide synthase D [Herbihabitans rhizosphaerae]|uniref:Phthiocerol/phenolphthiocerol synthesis type-I polyketide synthase D n=1 Tax=Herbihabitans rhizosphaerae TaxID=1872711 RepID=A0A4Q7KQY5_9PSEU|nr:type I polyketide synthase [Herbihabitans rhizosphaerae]RZS39249.1 phthiocerol/phenolphthiocerol synthesis type-I polyketide synthase D [Herbihabitans rhizosphaerae]
MTTGPAELARWLVDRVAIATGRRPESVDPHRPVHELGLSSRDGVALAAELADKLGTPVDATLVYRHSTIAAIAEAVVGQADQVQTTRQEPKHGDPVAVIGVGCRLPGGVESPADFWRLLDGGVDAIRTRPEGRWSELADDDALAGLPSTGGYLDDVAGFDAEFFAITPREAAVMDPQQRMMLEVSHAALEHAGIASKSLRGTRTGVFVGLSATEYGTLTLSDVDGVDSWSGTGAAASVIANRLSYLLDLRGPSLAIDTACSSSLVAVHQAVQSLRAGEVDLAIVGGVNALVTPGITANFARAGVLAEDGRCKAFDASADGIARGEGCGVVVLRRLSDARRSDDRVLAVIRDSAVNSDGRSNGLMAPNPEAQADLLRAAYSTVDPSTVDYVEAHGTGTLLGDPIEAAALGEVLGADRPDDCPLWIGSVKSNFGHLEGAAGVTGLIKVVLSLVHQQIPTSLHYREPNPHIDFAARRLRVAGSSREWPKYSGLAKAGVSAFGFGGTNAHVVLEEWPTAPAPEPAGRRPEVFALSAVSEEALHRRAEDLAAWVRHADAPLADVAATLAARRDHHPVRAAVVAADRAELADALRSVEVRRAGASDVVFVFSGYGSQWSAMGAGLLEHEPAFRAAVDELEPEFLAVAGFSLREAISGEITDLAVAQSAVFGTQVALAAWWRAHGVTPAAVIGHSMGEVAAAVVAGALDLRDGLRVITTRARLLAGLSGRGLGAMAVVDMSADELAEFPVDIAVYASPGQCTITGPAAEVDAVLRHADTLGRWHRRMRVGGAGHSADVDPLLPEFRALVGDLSPRAPEVRCYSTVHSGPPEFGVDYWTANLRWPVRFTQAISAAIADGHSTFLEVSPNPITVAAIEQTGDVLALPSLRRTDADRGCLPSLAVLHTIGAADLARRHPEPPVVDLPGPAWRHERYWAPAPRRTSRHPLLGEHVVLPDGRHVWQAEVDTGSLPWLADHQAYGVTVLAGTAYLELALSAGRAALGGPVRVRDLELHQLLAVDERTTITTTVDPDGRVTVQAGAEWTTHATALVLPADGEPAEPLSIADGEALDLYAVLARAGQEYGPAFRGLHDVRAVPGSASAAIRLPDEAGQSRGFTLHPALADACLHTLAAAAHGMATGRYLPAAIGEVRVLGDPARGVRCAGTLAVGDGNTLTGAVHLLGPDGELLVDISGVVVRRLRAGAVPVKPADLAYELRWDKAPLPEESGTPSPRRVITLDQGDSEDAPVRAALAAVRQVEPGERLWLVTRNAPPALAALRALVRVLAFEHPDLRATLVDLDDESAGCLDAELDADQRDDEVLWRNGIRYSARLAKAELTDREAPVVRPGAYVITGGLGELGLLVAEWLAERGARRIVLSGRRAPAPEAEATLVRLRESGTEVDVLLGDIAEPGTAEKLVAHAGRDGVPLHGVLHAAAVLRDAAAMDVTDEDLTTVWRPKVVGAQRLHEATLDVELDWWLMFSSVASMFGSPGQAAYATANAWLDAFVARRRATGLPAATINWGAWEGEHDRANAALASVGRTQGLDALQEVLASGRAATGIAHLDLPAALDAFPTLAELPFLAELAPAVVAATSGADGWPGADGLRDLPPAEAMRMVLDRLAARLAALIGTSQDRVDVHVPLTSMGLDSLMAMRMRAAIQHDLGAPPPVSLLLRGASLADLAAHLVGEAPQRPRGPIPPRDPTERWIAQLWQDALGRNGFGVHDDFFTLGGTGSLADAVHESITARLAGAPGAEALFARPTVAAMADLLRDELEGSPDGPVRVLREEGAESPLFLFHPAGGPTSVYQPLIAALPDGRPCYGFERVDELESLPDKASRYVELLREIAPHGPYLLGGWSFGGLLAYEVAHRLTAAGERVELVALIDTILPKTGETDVVQRFQRFAEHIRDTYGVDFEVPDSLRDLPEHEQIEHVMTTLATAVPDIGEGALRHQRTSYVDARVAERYQPRPYGGRVVLLRATDPHPLTTTLDSRYLRDDEALGWDDLCADLRVIRVPGDHVSMIDPPHVAVLADRLREVLP